MARIDQLFRAAKDRQEGLLLPFVTAGYPDLATTSSLLGALERAGVQIVELGIPFSDPIADGPVIAESMHAALAAGVTTKAIFDAMKSLRASDAPGSTLALLAMVSISIVHRHGMAAFVSEAADAGFAGIIVPDIDLDDADDLANACAERGMACVFLVAPTTSPDRIASIARASRGFVYLLARAGVTGESSGVPDIAERVRAIRSVAGDLPIAAGFGVASADQVAAVVRHAEGAIVGSAIVRRIGGEVEAGRDPCPAVEAMVRELSLAARRRSA